MDRGNQNWLYNCEYVMEVPKPKNEVPYFLPGKNPFIEDFAKKFGLPFEAVFARRAATYPEYEPKSSADAKAVPVSRGIRALLAARERGRAARSRPSASWLSWPPHRRARSRPSRRFTCKATSTCWRAPARTSPCRSATRACSSSTRAPRRRAQQVLAAVRRLSTKPIRWIVNTSADVDHTGGNETLSQAGKTVNGNPAAIIAHENVLGRMTEPRTAVTELPLNTFFEPARDFSFNGEAIFLYHVPAAHTDGDIFVYFRGSDVLVSGDLFTTTAYPVIDSRPAAASTASSRGSTRCSTSRCRNICRKAAPT